MENRVAAFAAAATLGFVAGAFTAEKTQQADAGARVKTVTVVADAQPKSGTELLAATTRRRKPVEVRYLVKPGDTLWDIAAAHYQNAADGMRRIKNRNGLRREKVLAGEILVLPAAGQRD